METHLGLTPEEMISIFNRMYLDVWEKTKGNINWELAKISQQIKEGKDVDVSRLMLEVLEVVITATRDGFVVAMYENNEKIFNDLRAVAQRQLQETGDVEEDLMEEREAESINIPNAEKNNISNLFHRVSFNK